MRLVKGLRDLTYEERLRALESTKLRSDLIIAKIYNGKTFSTTSLKKQHRQYRKLVKIKKWLMLTGGGRELGE